MDNKKCACIMRPKSFITFGAHNNFTDPFYPHTKNVVYLNRKTEKSVAILLNFFMRFDIMNEEKPTREEEQYERV